jgi:hypothetical protein
MSHIGTTNLFWTGTVWFAKTPADGQALIRR